MLGAFVPLAASSLPGHQRPEWLPEVLALVPTRRVIGASLGLGIEPILVLAFDSTSYHGFSFLTACIRCLSFVYRQLLDRQLFDQCPCGLRPTPLV